MLDATEILPASLIILAIPISSPSKCSSITKISNSLESLSSLCETSMLTKSLLSITATSSGSSSTSRLLAPVVLRNASTRSWRSTELWKSIIGVYNFNRFAKLKHFTSAPSRSSKLSCQCQVPSGLYLEWIFHSAATHMKKKNLNYLLWWIIFFL